MPLAIMLLLPFEQVTTAMTAATWKIKGALVSRIKTGENLSWQSYKKSVRHFFYSPFNGLPVMANGQLAFPSGAADFHGLWKASVDPRTGMATFKVTITSLLYNKLRARRDLVLSYIGNPGAMGPDPFDLGSHWRWNIGMEHMSSTEVKGHMTTEIMTGQGKRFTMISDRDPMGKTIWHPLRHKLKDVVIQGKPGDWTITFSSGLREHIKNGYEDWEQAKGAPRLGFFYGSDGASDTVRHLTGIYVATDKSTVNATNTIKKNGSNPESERIALTWRKNSFIVYGQQRLLFEKGSDAGINQIHKIIFPSLSSRDQKDPDKTNSMRFVYDAVGNRPWLLRSVYYPTGAQTLFLYNDESSRHAHPQINGLPVGLNGASLPVVTEQVTLTGNDAVPARHEWFDYSGLRGTAHNYTGYQGNAIMIPGRDNLLDREDSYTYRTTYDTGRVKKTTVYNKYHLPVKVILRDDRDNSILAASEEVYPLWKGTTFEQLPADYSFPRRSIRTYYGSVSLSRGKEHDFKKIIASQKYDSKGQVIWRRDSAGRETFIQYCPPGGDTHCPAENPSWPEINRPEKIITVFFDDDRKAFAQGSVNSEKKVSRHVFEKVINYRKMPSGEWKTMSTMAGYPEVEKIGNIISGESLPDLSPKERLIEHRYIYNSAVNSDNYGDLIKAITIRYSLDSLPFHVKSLSSGHAGKPDHYRSLMFGIRTSFNNNTRTKTTEFVAGNGKTMGKVVFSLDTGLKLSEDSPSGSIHTEWYYDGWKRPVKKVVSLSSGGTPHITHWDYFALSNEIGTVVTGPFGHQRKKVMSPDGKVISTWHRFRRKKVSEWIPDSAYTYTETGKVKSITAWHAGDVENGKPGKPVPLTTTFGYDALDREIWQKRPDGQVDFSVYDDTKMRVIHYRAAYSSPKGKWILWPAINILDANLQGKPATSYTLSLNGYFRKNEHFLYNDAFRKTLDSLKVNLFDKKLLSYSGILPVTGKNGLLNFVKNVIASRFWVSTKTINYDSEGRPVQTSDDSGMVRKWQWKKGSLVASLMPDGRIVRDDFDIHGKRISRCMQPAHETVCHNLGKRGFDSQGNLLWEMDTKGHTISYVYDDEGRLVKKVMPAAEEGMPGHTFRWKYNSIGPVSVSVDGIPFVIFTYDRKSWRLKDKEDRTHHEHYVYDEAGRLTDIIFSSPKTLRLIAGIKYPAVSMHTSWNRYNHPVSYTDFAGNEYKSIHDRFGRVVMKYVRLPKQRDFTLLLSTRHDIFSRVIKAVNGGGITRFIKYDALGNLASTTDYKNNTLFQALYYKWNPVTGNLLSMVRQEDAFSATEDFEYDRQNNLVHMRCYATGQPGKPDTLCPRDLDIAGSTFVKPPYITDQRYTFDHWNHIKTVTEVLKKDNFHQPLTKTTLYHYEGEGNAKKQDIVFSPGKITSIEKNWSDLGYRGKPGKILWDALGHMVRDSDGNRLRYNAFGRLSQFINSSTKEMTRYTYDSAGNQIAIQSFDSKNNPLQNPLYLVYENNGTVSHFQEDASHHQHVSAELESIAHAEDGEINTWYIHDYKGDVINRIGVQGELISDNVYSPYGMRYDRLSYLEQSLPKALTVNIRLPLWQSRFPGFNGQITETGTGYQFYGNGYRAYNPVYRGFLSRDSYSPFRTLNDYAFNNNNPVMNVDPSGHLPAWAGYVMAGTGFGLSVLLGVLMPVTAIATMSLMGANANALVIVAGVGNIFANMLGGCLQIVHTVQPKNKTLGIVNGALNSIALMASFALGCGSLVAGAVGYSIRQSGKIVEAFASISGTSGALAGLAGATASAMETAYISRDGKVSSAYGNGMDYLNYISWFFTAGAMALGVGAGVFAHFRKMWSSNRNRTPAFDVTGTGSVENEMRMVTLRRNQGRVNSVTSSTIDFGRTGINTSMLRDIQTDIGLDYIKNISTEGKTTLDLVEIVKSHENPERVGRAIEHLDIYGALNDENINKVMVSDAPLLTANRISSRTLAQKSLPDIKSPRNRDSMISRRRQSRVKSLHYHGRVKDPDIIVLTPVI